MEKKQKIWVFTTWYGSFNDTELCTVCVLNDFICEEGVKVEST